MLEFESIQIPVVFVHKIKCGLLINNCELILNLILCNFEVAELLEMDVVLGKEVFRKVVLPSCSSISFE